MPDRFSAAALVSFEKPPGRGDQVVGGRVGAVQVGADLELWVDQHNPRGVAQLGATGRRSIRGGARRAGRELEAGYHVVDLVPVTGEHFPAVRIGLELLP